MRQSIPAGMSVKASGGSRRYKDAAAMAQTGAARILASAGIKILKAAE